MTAGKQSCLSKHFTIGLNPELVLLVENSLEESGPVLCSLLVSRPSMGVPEPTKNHSDL